MAVSLAVKDRYGIPTECSAHGDKHDTKASTANSSGETPQRVAACKLTSCVQHLWAHLHHGDVAHALRADGRTVLTAVLEAHKR